MQLLNHHQQPCDTFSFGFAIIVLASFLFESTFAEYDCSAKDDGWYYDPEFCHVYWRCIHGTSEEFECASGTAWDHHANRCNWLDSVDCSRAEKTTAKAISGDDDGQDIVEEGRNDPDGEDDDRPTVVKKTKKKKKKPRKLIPDGDNTEGIDLFLLIISQTNSSADFLCIGRDGFFAHPEYCTRYYRCSHGMDEVFECPRGTAWDDITKSCAWVDQVNCEKKKLGYSTSTTTGDTTALNKKSDTDTVLSDSNILSAVVSTNGKDSNGDSPVIECQPTGIYSVADPAECNAYYKCDKGTRTRVNCPEGTLFDIEKRECNEYGRVSCGARSINPADKNQCINKRDGVHPDPERDCHYYYKCLGQNKMGEAKCPGDQKFNTHTGKCGLAINAPIPCGSFVPGSTAITTYRNIGGFIQIFVIMMIVFVLFDF